MSNPILPVIEMRGISKRFGSLVANDHIDLDIAPNEIHALLGENGAGKSTLMKILYGLYQPDEGDILINGQKVRLKSPSNAINNGIGLVSQHFSLVPTFTVAENVILGFEGKPLLHKADVNRTISDTAKHFGFSIDSEAIVSELSVGEQQRVEILKTLYRKCRVLILDEPTAVLTPRDTASLFAILRELQQQQLSVVIITHKLEEIMDISQRVTVLRLGKVVGREQTISTDRQSLARLMVGRNVIAVNRNTEHKRADSVGLEIHTLKLNDKRGIAVLSDLSFRVHNGEIVGIAGVAGNGQTELVSILNGTTKPDSGSVIVNKKPLELGDPRHLRDIARIPEDRLKGVIADLTVAENLTLEQIDDFTHIGHLNQRKMKETAKKLIADFHIKAKAGDRVRTLSGGNIQKIILARTLSRKPSVVIAAQPTRGLDIGATEYVHEKLLEQKARGAAVLLVSEDLDETLILSDRILVIYKGRIVGEFDAENINLDHISLLMAGSTIDVPSTTLER